MNKRMHGVLLLAVIPMLGTTFPWPGAAAIGKPLVVIVASSTNVKDIGIAALRRAFQGQATDLGGKHLIPINHANGTPLRVSFDRSILGLEPAEVGRFWIDRRIRGEGSPPKTAPSLDLAVRLVASIPGAITYASHDVLNPSVRVLTIDGKAPDQPGYPLHE